MATSQDGSGDQWHQLAQKHWLNTSKPTIRPEVIKRDIWDALEADTFSLPSLALLENLQILEKLLWPTFEEDVSNQHIILITIFVNVKLRAHLQAWDVFTDRADDFSLLFRRVLSLNLDQSLPTPSRIAVLTFVAGAFQSLEKDFLRKECAPLVSISIWHNLQSTTSRDGLLESRSGLRKAWRASEKRFDAAESASQARMRFDRAWLYSMVLKYFRCLNGKSPIETVDMTYCEKFIEFVIDLISQLPTRRYTLPLLKDLNLIQVLRHSAYFKDDKSAGLRDLSNLLQHFVHIDADEGNDGASSETSTQHHYNTFGRLQRTSLKLFPEKLKVLALSNQASVDNRHELQAQFSDLSDAELKQICEALDIRTAFPTSTGIETTRQLLVDSLLGVYAKSHDSQDLARMNILPTEATLYDESLLRNENFDGSRPLALPKLNLQYLSMGDFLWRSFVLHRSEALYEIRKDIESTVKRMKPQPGRERDAVQFDGFSKMSIPVSKPAIIEVGRPNVGTDHPSFVRAEIAIDVRRLNDGIRREWDALHTGDVLFLLNVKTRSASSHSLINGHTERQTESDWELAHIRCAEVVQVLDDSGRPLRNTQNMVNGHGGRPQKRRLLVNLDTVAYKHDLQRVARGKSDVYAHMNVLVRRQRRENNFRAVLETMQNLLNTKTELPNWLQDVFLGYGNPRHASYPEMVSTSESAIDFLDTFVDQQHLIDSFPGKSISGSAGETVPSKPPYVLAFTNSSSSEPPSNPKKRRRDQLEDQDQPKSSVQVSSHAVPNTGPYPSDLPNVNKIRFTPKQVQALVSGVHPGLTVIIGPPGTGKTDVAAQLIHLLTSNYPRERILLLAHSNQALNQLFQKITALDIDPRQLLRLGHGEEELETEASYSKFGRVESFLENRQLYLSEVDRLAKSIGAEGAHGSTCETAEYFNQVHIEPAWAKFWSVVQSEGSDSGSIRKAFPFHKYFSNAPIPALFPHNASPKEMMDIAKGCQHHISKVFSELATVRPFEILRHSRDQQNHLLIKEARVIAMTSTHAAMRRSEIAWLGFHYDTLIMEEAAQITEIESFIPCAMQNPDSKTGELPLKRLVLVGDHLQNSPVIQHLALRQYSNYEQSMFLRLVRLGVPTIHLDQQGRCRPSIADLFRWRYTKLGDLPHIMQAKEFSTGNAGFKYDYQFIDVPDYQEQGEREPSPHFIQNLGEAEYAVALYQYMRLLGYPAKSISILTTYAGQKALIRDVLDHRCKANRIFGLPRIVTTVDKYQGEQNDYVIVSMTRTRSVGYLRDVRRLTVLLSRARLGLYILGRRELFETCIEMKPAMDLFTRRPDKLVLTTGEMFPTKRTVADDVAGTEMTGLEHLGQYVYEMTQAKVKALGGQIAMTPAEIEQESYVEDEGVFGAAAASDVEEDPLHEAV